jgi:hypothetical protein
MFRNNRAGGVALDVGEAAQGRNHPTGHSASRAVAGLPSGLLQHPDRLALDLRFVDVFAHVFQDETHASPPIWYEQHGMPHDAARNPLAARDADLVARLIEQHFDSLFHLQGERTTAPRWLCALPSDLRRDGATRVDLFALGTTSAGGEHCGDGRVPFFSRHIA